METGDGFAKGTSERGAGSPNGLTEGVSFDEWESEFHAPRVSGVLCETGACIAIAAHPLSFANAQQLPQRGSRGRIAPIRPYINNFWMSITYGFLQDSCCQL